ncbi:MAG: GatB/YqeY domain-containing protein, partial [Epsilonproteobacteria bacterium]|nr:GatB/YqeY domain-containing protein [Campylobacterota bacterium]
MSQLKTKLQDDLKEAMKNKDAFKRDAIRFLMSALKQIEVDERKELSDEDIMKIIQKS